VLASCDDIDSVKGVVDVGERVRLTAALYCRVAVVNWQAGKDVS
jgi:hypothetical protein